MARYRQSLALTSRYSRQLERTAARVQRLAEARWNLAPEDFDGSYSRWLDVVVPAVTQAQKQNQRLTTAYLTAYITSETGVRARLKTVGSVAGKNEDGRDLREAWDVPPIRAKQALMEGKELPVAMDIARASAMGLIGLGVYAGARVPMAEMLDATEETVGYTRVTGGNPCAACMGAADGTVFATDEVFEVHPGCDCTAEAVIDGIEDRVTRPTGQEVFDGLTEAEQNDRIGEAAADAVRGGTPLKDFIGHVDTNVGANWIIQRPLKDVA